MLLAIFSFSWKELAFKFLKIGTFGTQKKLFANFPHVFTFLNISRDSPYTEKKLCT
jgi:hypothetical protein